MSIGKYFALSVVMASTAVHAEITSLTGDIEYGPARDMVNKAPVCSSATDFFEMFQVAANTEDQAAVGAAWEALVKRGACTLLPPQTVYVNALRMAQISGSARKEPSVYTVAKIRADGKELFVLPNNLVGEAGFDIIKQSQQLNKRNGMPLVQ